MDGYGLGAARFSPATPEPEILEIHGAARAAAGFLSKAVKHRALPAPDSSTIVMSG
jgi:hypothetical protein